MKSNGLKGKRFDTIEALAAHLCHWNTTVAQLRIHGTTRRQVIRHFLEVEKPALQPLPADRFSLFEVGTRRVHDDGHVEVKAAFYSVPHTLVGREVRVHWDGNLVRVYRDGTAIAVHTRIEAGSWSTRPEHRPVHKPARQEAYEATQLARIEKIGPQVLAWAKEAVLERDVRSYRLLQGVLRLTRTHPKERIDWACGVALERRAFRYQTLKRLTRRGCPAGPAAATPSAPRADPRPRRISLRDDHNAPASRHASNPCGCAGRRGPERTVHDLRHLGDDTMKPDLDSRLRHLRLSGMAATLPVRNQEAVRNNLAHVDFLDLLVEDELNRRQDRLLERRIKQAGLPQLKTLDDFDWGFNPEMPKALIVDLATGRFVTERTGVLFVGPPGVGKSHICLSLALAAIHAGHTVHYRSAFDLVEDLSEAAALGARRELIQRLTRVGLVVIEDLGMRRLPPTAAEDLLEILTRRYETGATVISSNRPIEDWGQLLGDTAAAGAMLDRFLHHAEIVQLKGRSYRMHDRQRRRSQGDELTTMAG